ncbi:DUF3105 domain-containing protein [Streptomyces sp. DT224]|uniref:DUF3105 domain-containing protein n=1 Tax=unclassified Streptomyces TaxID=2593676 RepID=UPI0011CDD884|nr:MULTISPECIES: DUF3105 domain-containing protein [unclassified Streptomyces]TXS38257.1 DUF3105 domain-containing protein [Streptomyces sp. or43]WRZ03569.1 DUF3105 domain-containing protein [Streptomyces sp. NBC_00385]
MGTAKAKSAATARRAKLDELRRVERARERRNKIITVVICAVIFVVLAGGAGYLLFTIEGEEKKQETARTSPIKGEKTWKKLTQNHVAKPVTYPMTPAAGGDHAQAWMNCNGDVYAKEVRQENAVHALEHGAVWVTYNDKTPASDVATLKQKVSQTPYTLMSPHSKQTGPITLTAWGKQLSVDSASDPRIATFFDKYVQGEQTPEPGAACTNGLTA